MEIKKYLGEFAISALPLAFLYFSGWAYLAFYLSYFNISIDEVTLDIPTIFIYAYTPLSILFKHYIWIMIGVLALLLIVIFGLSRRYNRQLPVEKWPRIAGADQSPPFYFSLLCYVVGIIVLFSILLLPIRLAAALQIKSIWDDPGQFIDPFPGIPESKATAIWKDRYVECRDRSALRLVFATSEKTFVLCRGNVIRHQGTIFEIRGEKGLMSARQVLESDDD